VNDFCRIFIFSCLHSINFATFGGQLIIYFAFKASRDSVEKERSESIYMISKVFSEVPDFLESTLLMRPSLPYLQQKIIQNDLAHTCQSCTSSTYSNWGH
jgi:hypothetical protein